jgi:hypothetical protein
MKGSSLSLWDVVDGGEGVLRSEGVVEGGGGAGSSTRGEGLDGLSGLTKSELGEGDGSMRGESFTVLETGSGLEGGEGRSHDSQGVGWVRSVG